MTIFERSSFNPIRNFFNSLEINRILGDYSTDFKINDEFPIHDISSIENLKNNSLIFINKEIHFNSLNFSNILAITNNIDIYKSDIFKNMIFVSDLNKSYNLILNSLFYHEDADDYQDNFISKDKSFISEFSKIDHSTKIGINSIIGRGCIVGKNCIIKNNVVIKNAIIGDNVNIGDNTTIGSTGFGFDLNKLGAKNLSPQIGIVHIDDNVLIGSNCSIDRGKIDITYIGKNTMIDNLVHIAHNVHVGDNGCIAAQTGISGSVKIGKNMICGGQVGFNGHIKIGDNVVIAAKSGVTKNIKDKSIVAGFPATDINKWKKNIIKNRK